MDKRQLYTSVLKKALTESSNSDGASVRGPMLSNVIDYTGDGEYETSKELNAATILERFYFQDDSSYLIENVDNEIDEVPPTSDGITDEIKDQIEKELTEAEDDASDDDTEQKAGFNDELKEAEEDEDHEEPDADDEGGESDNDEDDKEKVSESSLIENAVIRKLIQEMEDETHAAGDNPDEFADQVPNDRDDDTGEDDEPDFDVDKGVSESDDSDSDDEKKDDEEEEKPSDSESKELAEAYRLFREEAEGVFDPSKPVDPEEQEVEKGPLDEDDESDNEDSTEDDNDSDEDDE